jgi:EAL and modified HD-GYP domain-containing signal transduction protein
MGVPTEPTITKQEVGDASFGAYITRQAIYDQGMQLFAYELLYQRKAAAAEGSNSDTLLNTLLGVGLEGIVGSSPAFAEVSEGFILSNASQFLPKDRFILILPPRLKADDSVLRSLNASKEAGCAIALNYTRNREDGMESLLELANYVNVDFRSTTATEGRSLVPDLKRFKAKCVARQLRTYAEFENAVQIGCDYFEGPCFDRPRTATADGVPPNRFAVLKLLQELQEPEIEIGDLEKLIAQDVAISFKLLRYVNSALISLSNNIQSIKHAIQLVGTQRIRLWASILIMFSFEGTPAELIMTALTRARMAEGLAIAMNAPNPNAFYTVGLFSVIDAMLDIPMSKAADLLPFPALIRDALVNQRGQMGAVLSCVLAYEAADWQKVRCGNLSPSTIRQAYLDSVTAAEEMRKALG